EERNNQKISQSRKLSYNENFEDNCTIDESSNILTGAHDENLDKRENNPYSPYNQEYTIVEIHNGENKLKKTAKMKENEPSTSNYQELSNPSTFFAYECN
ncbi:MAG: hypothetical protein MHPSP_004326, partial [Paramarteilia canceri]